MYLESLDTTVKRARRCSILPDSEKGEEGAGGAKIYHDAKLEEGGGRGASVKNIYLENLDTTAKRARRCSILPDSERGGRRG